MAELAATFIYVGEGKYSYEPVGGGMAMKHTFHTVEINGCSMNTSITDEQAAWALKHIPANISRFELIHCPFTVQQLNDKLIRNCPRLTFDNLLKISP